MTIILHDSDLKRDDLKNVPMEHIELSDFRYYSDPDGVFIGRATSILFLRDKKLKVFKHGLEFPNVIVDSSKFSYD